MQRHDTTIGDTVWLGSVLIEYTITGSFGLSLTFYRLSDLKQFGAFQTNPMFSIASRDLLISKRNEGLATTLALLSVVLAIGLFLIDRRSKDRDAARARTFEETTTEVLKNIEEVSNRIQAMAVGIKQSLEPGQAGSFSLSVGQNSKQVIIGAFREFVTRWERFDTMNDYDKSQIHSDLQATSLSLADKIIHEASTYSEFIDPDFRREAIEKANLIRTFGEHRIMFIGRQPWDEMLQKCQNAHYGATSFLASFAQEATSH